NGHGGQGNGFGGGMGYKG
ncbi:hypothetical protein NPIL_575981, partial [Nephila pilipes]